MLTQTVCCAVRSRAHGLAVGSSTLFVAVDIVCTHNLQRVVPLLDLT